MIVVDTNVVAYRFIAGEKTDLACEVQKKDGAWIVPNLWRHEFLNVLATAVRSGVIDNAGAFTIWRGAVYSLANNERAINYETALTTAINFRVSAYDAQFIALAQALNCLCVTEDSRLRKEFPKTAFSMREYLEMKA